MMTSSRAGHASASASCLSRHTMSVSVCSTRYVKDAIAWNGGFCQDRCGKQEAKKPSISQYLLEQNHNDTTIYYVLVTQDFVKSFRFLNVYTNAVFRKYNLQFGYKSSLSKLQMMAPIVNTMRSCAHVLPLLHANRLKGKDAHSLRGLASLVWSEETRQAFEGTSFSCCCFLSSFYWAIRRGSEQAYLEVWVWAFLLNYQVTVTFGVLSSMEWVTFE